MESEPRKCEECGSDLPPEARSHARFCSGRCRVRAHRRDKIPAELRNLPRWVRHTHKRPITTAGRPASSTDPADLDRLRARRGLSRG